MTETFAARRASLLPRAFTLLPLGAVKPTGWLLSQLRVQADGLSGHLDEFWPDLGPDNMWRGGSGEGWERAPYYLDGLVPLAHLLEDKRLLQKAQGWIDSILALQDDTGWIGPVKSGSGGAWDGQPAPYDPWPLMLVCKVLTQHHDATGDARVLPALLRFARWLHANLDAHPLLDWGVYRWAELVLSLHWIYNRTGEAFLLDVAEKAKAQGFDWHAHFAAFPFTHKTPPDVVHDPARTRQAHGVNNAMAVKAGGVWARQSGDPADADSSRQMIALLDRYHGQVTGMFSGDEHLAGREPSQGTETCSVVEYLFSLEELLAALGDPAFADRAERIAFNALPAALDASMRSRQYDQQPNQVLVSDAPRAWTSNSDPSNLFSLEGHFGCCTANFHQGWPKFVKSLWMATPDGGLAATLYGPCRVTTTVAGGVPVTMEENTEYPFREDVVLTVTPEWPVSFPLLLRVPEWAEGATVTVNDEAAQAAVPGTFHRIERQWRDGDRVRLHFPMPVRVEQRPGGAVSVGRGPLVLSLAVGEEWRQTKNNGLYGDWEVLPTTAWNYALVPEAGFTVQEHPTGPVPFARDAAPVTVTAKAVRVPEWRMQGNSAGPVPPSPVTSDAPVENVTLVPYGCARLRVSEFPHAPNKRRDVPKY